MNAISHNPYRLLGVYSNSPTKERIANKGKMNAFLKVGRTVEFPLDLPQLLSPINRTVESVSESEAKLTLPNDQIRFAQFWWIKSSPLDDVAFNNLINGDIDKAISIWDKKDNMSSLLNRIVLSLIKRDYATGIRLAEMFYAQYATEFVVAIAGETAVSDAETMSHYFLDTLIENGVNPTILLQYITDVNWRSYVNEKTIGPIVDTINQATNESKASKGKGSNARLKAGQKLMADTKSELTKLKSLIPTNDIRYQTVVDKLANEILQCGIDYYNGSDDDDAAHKAMKLQEYALSIAVGSVAKGRCKENFDILKKIIDELPPASVMPQYRAIMEELNKYGKLPDKISHAITLLNNCKSHLQTIKSTLGATNSHYLKLSTVIVNAALHNLIEEVNEAQKDETIDIGGRQVPISMLIDRDAKIAKIKDALSSAWRAITIIDQFDMESDFRSNRYNPNRTTLKSLCSQLGISTGGNSFVRPTSRPSAPSRPNPPSGNSSSGCYIATMAYGDYDHPQVMILRNFRDNYLAQRNWGKKFIKMYYKYSPRLVERLKNHPLINRVIRNILDVFVSIIK